MDTDRAFTNYQFETRTPTIRQALAKICPVGLASNIVTKIKPLLKKWHWDRFFFRLLQ